MRAEEGKRTRRIREYTRERSKGGERKGEEEIAEE